MRLRFQVHARDGALRHTPARRSGNMLRALTLSVVFTSTIVAIVSAITAIASVAAIILHDNGCVLTDLYVVYRVIDSGVVHGRVVHDHIRVVRHNLCVVRNWNSPGTRGRITRRTRRREAYRRESRGHWLRDRHCHRHRSIDEYRIVHVHGLLNDNDARFRRRLLHPHDHHFGFSRRSGNRSRRLCNRYGGRNRKRTRRKRRGGLLDYDRHRLRCRRLVAG